jgi:peptide deformylase
MELVLYPDPILRRVAKPLTRVDDEVRARVAEMFEIMYANRGVGLAAPQVGWSERLFVVNVTGEPDPRFERVYINPEVTVPPGGVEELTDDEGCLSIPGVHGRVARHQRVVVRALDLAAQRFEEEVCDLDARVVQHELDHLDGILFITRLGTTDRMQSAKTLKELEKEYKRRRA